MSTKRQKPPAARCATLKADSGCAMPLVPRVKSHPPLKRSSFKNINPAVKRMTVVRRFHIKKSVGSTLASAGYIVAGLIIFKTCLSNFSKVWPPAGPPEARAEQLQSGLDSPGKTAYAFLLAY